MTPANTTRTEEQSAAGAKRRSWRTPVFTVNSTVQLTQAQGSSNAESGVTTPAS
jgi:hypothetical protein